VGFDRTTTATPLNSVTIPGSVDPLGAADRKVVGGLMYAGINGNKTTQGNPPTAKFSPRVGIVYSMDTKTVIRAGYGMYWAPWNYPVPSATSNNGNYGQIGFTNNTSAPQTAGTPAVTLANPFPNGLVPPYGNTNGPNGLLGGVGTSIAFVDQNRTAPRVQQYSADFQRELIADMAITFSYVGARGDHLPLGGTVDSVININQLDPKYLAVPAAVLSQSVPNPFFGNPNAGPFANSPTIARSQLLRPYPQFSTINMLQVSEGVNRYNAAVVELTKRVTHGWGGRFSYTYSVLKDNQFGESNFFSTRNANPMNNFNYDATLPACTSGDRIARYSQMCFDPMVDYAYGLLDVPHRFIVAPIVNLPFGKDHKIGKSGIGNLLAGGWTAAAVFTFQSGFPFGMTQSNSNSNLQGNSLRPNLTGTSFETSGDLSDRIGTVDHASAAWLNSAAISAAPAGTWGNAPRTITEVRTPRIINTDLSVQKAISLSGGKTASIKIEVVNLFNRPQFAGFASTTQAASNFGQITSQAGFMRLTQFMFRYSW
jgi:hypothetical protein